MLGKAIRSEPRRNVFDYDHEGNVREIEIGENYDDSYQCVIPIFGSNPRARTPWYFNRVRQFGEILLFAATIGLSLYSACLALKILSPMLQAAYEIHHPDVWNVVSFLAWCASPIAAIAAPAFLLGSLLFTARFSKWAELISLVTLYVVAFTICRMAAIFTAMLLSFGEPEVWVALVLVAYIGLMSIDLTMFYTYRRHLGDGRAAYAPPGDSGKFEEKFEGQLAQSRFAAAPTQIRSREV